MTVKTGTAWAGTFVTQDATGALATPSTGPAGVLYVDGVANAAEVTITGTNPYKFAVTLPALTAGQRVDMYITATIATIATAGVVASEQADTAILSDGVVVNSGTVTTLTNLPTMPNDWLTAAGLKADAVTKIQANLALEATLTAIKGAGWSDQTLVAIDVLLDLIKSKTDTITAAPTAESVADAVWDEILAVHSDVGSTGEALTTAGGSGDPWSTVLPGAYGAGTAGKALSDVLADTGTDGVVLADNAITSSKIATDAIDADALKLDAITEIQSGLALETSLEEIKGLGWVNESLTGIQTSIDSGVLNNQTIADGKLDVIDGIVGDIKIVTDQFVFTIANQVDANSLTGSAGVTAQQVRAEMDSNSTRFILIEQLLRNRMITDPTTGIMTLYDDAGNPLLSAQIFQDAAGTIPYQGQGVERRERLT